MLALAAPACAAASAKAGLVLDLQGPAEVAHKDAPAGALRLLDYLEPGARLMLPPGSRVSVSHYASKTIYRLAGPVQAEVEASGLRHLSGTPLQAAAIGEKTVSAALNPNLGPAAFKLRGMAQVVMRSPANGGAILELRPLFRWDAGESGSYQVEVVELPARTLARGQSSAQVWSLPPGVELKHGRSYRWSVSYTSAADGKMRGAAATFSLPSRTDADLIASLAPEGQASIDEWVLYATILKDWNMVDAAQGVWARIAERRPDLGHAR